MLNLTTGGSIAFSGASAGLNSAGGNITLTAGAGGAITSGGAAVDITATGKTISLTAGSGGIGAGGNPLVVSGSHLSTLSTGAGDQYLANPVADGITVDSVNIASGRTIEFSGGSFTLSGNDAISTGSKLTVNGATLVLADKNQTVDTFTLAANGSVSGTTGVLTSTNQFQMQSGTASAQSGRRKWPFQDNGRYGRAQ